MPDEVIAEEVVSETFFILNEDEVNDEFSSVHGRDLTAAEMEQLKKDFGNVIMSYVSDVLEELYNNIVEG